MEKEELTGYNVTFTAPSGYEYTIREQNGADDDILSNPSEASTLINISRFIAGIVIDTNSTTNRKLTVEQAHMMPSLDRYAILIKSRILSNGEDLEFEYDWGPDGVEKVLIANHWMNTYLIIQRKLMMILWLVNQML